MAGRLEIQNYGDRVVLRSSTGGEGTVVTLTPSEPQEDIEATGVFHRAASCTSKDDAPALAFVGTSCGVFAVDTRTGKQLAQLLGNKREVRCFQAVRDTLYVGVKDTTEPAKSNFGLWAIDMSAITARPIKKVGDWEVVGMVLNSEQSQMAMTYCQWVNGSPWFEVHLFGVHHENGGIEYQQRIGGDGWGKVGFSEDDTMVIIDGQECPIPSQFFSSASASASGAGAAGGAAGAGEVGTAGEAAAAAAAAAAAGAAGGAAGAAVKTTLGKRYKSRGTRGEDGDQKSEMDDSGGHASIRSTRTGRPRARKKRNLNGRGQ